MAATFLFWYERALRIEAMYRGLITCEHVEFNAILLPVKVYFRAKTDFWSV